MFGSKKKQQFKHLFIKGQLEFRELDVSPGNTEVKQGNFIEFICPNEGYFREMCKSQNIDLIFPTPKSNLGIIQIIIKSGLAC